MLYIFCRYNPEYNRKDDFILLLQEVAKLNGIKIFYDAWINLLQNEEKDALIDFVQRADLVLTFNLGYKNFYQWRNGNSISIKEDDLTIKHITEKDDYEEHECILVQNYDELIYLICDDTKENITSFVQIACCSTSEQLHEWYKNNFETDEKDVNARISISETALNQRRFKETDMISIQGTRIYRELKTNNLLHLDNFHKKEEAHIEVYRKDWTFIGTFDLQCEEFTPTNKKKKARKLRIKNTK